MRGFSPSRTGVRRSVTGYKKTPPFPAGSQIYWMDPAKELGGVLIGSVRFEEAFKLRGFQRQGVATESDSRLTIQ